MTLPPQPAETWHGHYDDPNGDLTLVSNERVKFRTSARLLAKTCDNFGNLPADHPLSINGPGSTIHLDHSTDSVEKFLDIASVSTPILTTSYEETLQLLAVADHFHSHKLLPHIKERLYTFTDRYAVNLMALASTRDDWEMGQRIIRKLDTNRVKEILARPGGIEGFFNNLRPTWRHTLMELIFFATFNDRKLLYAWQDVHEDFVASEDEDEELEEQGEEEAVGEIAAGEIAEGTGEKRRASEQNSATSKRVKVEE